MATGGTGDILTGLIAGFLGQFPDQPEQAIAAAVYLHGLSGELARRLEAKNRSSPPICWNFFPQAIHACANLPDPI